MRILKDNCANLITLETLLRIPWQLEYVGAGLSAPSMIAGVLEVVDARFKAIPSLEQVIVHIHNYEGPSNDLSKEMSDCGWTIRFTQRKHHTDERENMDYEDVDFEGYLEMGREREMEEAWFVEEYYRRRKIPSARMIQTTTKEAERGIAPRNTVCNGVLTLSALVNVWFARETSKKVSCSQRAGR